MRTGVVLTAGLAGIGVGTAVAAARRGTRHAAEKFYEWEGPIVDAPEVNGIRTKFPGYVNRFEQFGSFHAADAEAVKAMLPTEALHPVKLPDGRAIVFIGAAHYREFTLTGTNAALLPYGEVSVAAVVSRGDAPPVVPLVGRGLPIPHDWQAGMFFLALPVTQRWARDAGWTEGFPKFMADLDFRETVVTRGVRAMEGDQLILDVEVPADGEVRLTTAPTVGYSAHDGKLLIHEARTIAYERMAVGGRGATLVLGTHPVAERLRDLRLDLGAFATLVWVQARGILPAGREIGEARPFDAYRGTDEWVRRYTVAYPNTPPLDQYAYLTREGIERTVRHAGGRLTEDYARLGQDLHALRQEVRPTAA